jgi:hypothetical protein
MAKKQDRNRTMAEKKKCDKNFDAAFGSKFIISKWF